MSNLQHLVITPVRNEAEFLPNCIKSVLSQTMRPTKWILIDDNSDIETKEILSELLNGNSWIEIVQVSDGISRKRGERIAKLVSLGLSKANLNWDYFSKIDGDIILPKGYFQNIFSEFEDDPELGIASGNCKVKKGSGWRVEKVSSDHTRGAIKTYRASCFREIGGIEEVDGWDGIDNIMAQMAGWKTKNFPEILVEHQRNTGSANGLIRGRFETGRIAHYMGYHPIFMILRCAGECLSKPMIIGGFAMLAGYFYRAILGGSIFPKPGVVKFMRKKQLSRIGLSKSPASVKKSIIEE